MALLGCLSLVQIVFLPGWIALRLLRVPTSRFQTLVLSFGLSLVVNHFLVVGLVALHTYRPVVLYTLLAVETLIALWLACDRLAQPISAAWTALRQERRNVSDKLGLTADVPGWQLRSAAVLAAAGVIIAYALGGLCQAGDIFRQWDAVVSWNRWAIDWAQNGWPQSTSLYPQLLPANVSITYVFMQSSELWCFGKGFQFLFCLMTLAAMFDLAVARRSPGIVVGVVITYVLFVAILRYRMLASGYADMPLAFFTFTSIAMLLNARDCRESAERRTYLIAGCILVAGAALTKQAGLYIAGIYPLLAWQLVYLKHETWQATWPKLLRMAVVIGLFVAPWYVLKKFEASQGHDQDNTLSLIKGFQAERTVPQRFIYAIASTSAAVTPIGLACIAILLAIALADRSMRLMVLGVIVPWALIWSLGFSYDLRNLAMLLPLVGVACGVALEKLIPWFQLRDRAFSRVACDEFIKRDVTISSRYGFRIAHAVTALAAIAIICCLQVDDNSLRAAQCRQQREVGIPELNALLYEYDRTHGIQGLVATDYLAMPWLPNLAGHRLACSPQNLQSIKAIYERPDVRYALFCRDGTSSEVWNYLQQPGYDSASRMVFETKLYRFFVKTGNFVTGSKATNAQSVARVRQLSNNESSGPF